MFDKEYPTAVHVLVELLAKYPTDVNLCSALGRVYLHMGCVPLATEAFQRADALIPSRELPSSLAVNMNR